jgi:hypothetical protein
MERMEIAARFIAFTAILNRDHENPASPQEAGQFARENWTAFLPYATEGLSNFLTNRTVLPRAAACARKGGRRRASRKAFVVVS